MYLNKKKIIDFEKIKNELPRIFKAKSTKILNKIHSKTQYIEIEKNLTKIQIHELKKLGDPGIVFHKSSKRVYPQHNLFSHVTGFLSKYLVPKSKIEKNLNKKLEIGTSLNLSLDLRVQSIVHEELLKSKQEYEANSALAVVMNATTGEILSMVSVPDFDPNYPEKILPFSENNLVTEARYEMGSTLKMINAAMAHEFNSSALKKTYNVSEGYWITEEKFIEPIPGQKKLNFDEVFIRSSNVGSIKILEEIGIEKQREFFKYIGLNEDLKIDGLRIVSNNLPQNWDELASRFISYGYGISLSPISLISTFSTLVNGGFRVQPKITKGGKTPQEKILKDKTSKKINLLLKKIVLEGTGKKAYVEGINVGGKTGTSKKLIDGEYNEKKLITSFIGTFPIEDPKFSVLILFDEPKRKNEKYLENFGGNTAAPTFAKIVKKISPILNQKNYYVELE